MSRNYELLQRVGYAAEAATRRGTAATAESVASHPPQDLAMVADAIPFAIPEAHASEFDSLAQRLLSRATGRAFVAVFSHVEARPGSAAITAGLATLLAKQDTRPVCVVDANFLCPTLHNLFGVSNDHGLVDVLSGEGSVQEFAHRVPGTPLVVLTTGILDRSNGQLQALWSRLAERVTELRSQFATVLIIATPLSRSTFAVTLGRLADGVVMIIEANSTPRDVAKKAKQDLESAQVTLLGAVLNRRQYPLPKLLYDSVK